MMSFRHILVKIWQYFTFSQFNRIFRQRTLLECVYIIRDELHAAEILQRYDIAKPIIDLHNLKSIEKDVKNIFQEMIKKTFRYVLNIYIYNMYILFFKFQIG